MSNKDFNTELISLEDMQSYIACQMSGITNMLDVITVMDITELTREQVLNIINNYDAYREFYKL